MTDHKTEALGWLSLVNVEDGLERDDLAILKAHAHATLYLAEQQRVANLIEVQRFPQALESGEVRRSLGYTRTAGTDDR